MTTAEEATGIRMSAKFSNALNIMGKTSHSLVPSQVKKGTVRCKITQYYRYNIDIEGTSISDAVS